MANPSLARPDFAEPGNGLLLFFRVDNFDVALAKGRTLISRLEVEPHLNPNTGTAEFSLRDTQRCPSGLRGQGPLLAHRDQLSVRI
jgi:hypothetical protein